MFKLVVLSVLFALSAASPSLVSTHAVLPAAVSHQSRTDIISEPVVAAYAAPAVVKAAPVVAAAYAAPALAIPAATSHTYRTDVISKPVVATYAAAAPVVAETIVKAAPAYAAYAAPAVSYAAPAVSYAAPAVAYAAPAATSHTYRTDVINKPLIASTYATHALPYAYAYKSW